MAQINNNAAVATNNNVVVAMTKEEIIMMTKDEIRVALEACGVELSNAMFKRTKKADLVAQLEQYLDPTKKVEIVEAPVNAEDEVKKANGKKLVAALAVAWVFQSKYSVLGDGLHLFYIPTKRKDLQNVKISSRKRLLKVTGDLIGKLFGEKHNCYAAIQRAYQLMAENGLCHITKDGDVHMTVEEWNKAVTVYTNDGMKDAVADYSKFVAATVKPSTTKTAKVVSK